MARNAPRERQSALAVHGPEGLVLAERNDYVAFTMVMLPAPDN